MASIIMTGQQASISAMPKAAIQPANEYYRFPNNQTLHYDAEWRLWKAGMGTLRIEQNGEQEHVIGTAEASGAVAVLYRVQDRLESYFDRRSFCSQRILKHSEEGLHKRDTTLTFDPRGKSVLDERNLRNGETKHQENRFARLRDGCVVRHLLPGRTAPGAGCFLPVSGQ